MERARAEGAEAQEHQEKEVQCNQEVLLRCVFVSEYCEKDHCERKGDYCFANVKTFAKAFAKVAFAFARGRGREKLHQEY